ncbi:O-antigen ligase family protein [Candidatus Parcubacteria bacterium]|nr:O-antigen ligase family protein [Candidatus Parcubacteria bacterium]
MEIKNSKLRWFYLIGFCLILALPLLNIPPWFSPPDWGKTIVFRIIFSIMLFVFICQALFKKNNENFLLTVKNLLQPKSKVFLSFWLLVSLLGTFFLATIFSQDSYFSFFGSPYRAGGFLNFAFYIFFAILAFLILKKHDWQKIWNFAFIIGFLVSLAAIFQQLGLFSDILISVSWRPSSTTGAPSFLAIYLLLLIFLAISFAIQKRNKKSLFYLFCAGLFFYVISITLTRAAYLGLIVGFSYFFFFYLPASHLKKKFNFLKISVGLILILGILGSYWLNKQPELPQFIQEIPILQNIITRPLSIETAFSSISSRSSGWKVALKALEEKPILGYGPENFSIGFDKHYDPSIPNITKTEINGGTGWWDRAHNFVFEISVCSGIPALIIYLLLFGTLFWQLQKRKKENPNKTIIYHGIQAAFLAYLTANFFSFDSYSSYIISFLLIAYSLHLIQCDTNDVYPQHYAKRYGRANMLIIFVLFIGLIWFNWNYNLKPLQINKEIKLALWEIRAENCPNALAIMEKSLLQHSIIDSHVRLEYIDIINSCFDKESDKNKKKELIEKAIQALKENTEIQPNYTRNWWFLGIYTNYLIDIADKKELKQQANYYFERANSLSPKRQEIFKDWIKTHILTGEYQKAKEKARECVDISVDFAECWQLKGLSQIYLGEIKQGKECLKIAKKQGYALESYKSLSQLVSAYIKVESYPDLIEIYPKIIKFEPENFQYWASLAVCYQAVGDYENARKAAQKVIELSPESKPNVEEFLKTLK